MKKIMLSLGLMLAALTLTNCSNEIDENINANTDGVAFELTAAIDGDRTATDGFKTNWVAGDQINLFHAAAGTTTYVNDNAFKVDDAAAGHFVGTLKEDLTAEAHDWYALYPYDTNYTTPNGTRYYKLWAQSQAVEANSTAHVVGKNGPLYGVATEVATGDPVKVKMHHLGTLLKVKVGNEAEDFTIESIKIAAAQSYLTGSFYVGFDSTGITKMTMSGASYANKNVTLTCDTFVEVGTDGNDLCFYAAVAPFTAPAGEKLTITVTTDKGVATIFKDVPEGTEFKAGVVNSLNVYIEDLKTPDHITLPWTEDFSNKDLSKYTLKNGGTTTSHYPDDKLAGGAAKGELLISKENGSMTATITSDGTAKTLNFWFNSNYPADVKVSTTSSGVTITKVKVGGSLAAYTVALAEGVESFNLTLTNTKDSNLRVDDIVLTEEAPAMTSIAVTDVVSTSFNTGDTFKFDGVVKAVYANGTETVVESGYDVDDSTVDMNVAETYTVTVTYKGFSTTYSIIVNDKNVVQNYTDVLNRTLTGNTGTSYVNWSGKTSNSPAVYAGNSAGGNSSIQLRSNNSNSGIVTTTSGGYVTKVVVEWNSNTTSGRTLNVYGKNTAYSDATDLYNSSKQGTKIGTIVKGTSTELTINGEYKYIGLRSNSSAMYITKIEVYWSSQLGGGTTEPDQPAEPVQLVMSDVTCSNAGQSENSLTFTWTAVENASGYEVYFDSVSKGIVTTTSYTATGLAAGSSHTIAVKAKGDGTNFLTSTTAKTCTASTKAATTTPDDGEDDGEAIAPVTLSIAASEGILSGKEITWTSGALTVKNNQSTSSNAIRTSDTDHFRAYQDSVLTFVANQGAFTKIEVTCTESKYVSPLVNSLTSAGYTATSSGNVVTITCSGETEVSANLSAQTRFNKVVATF